jgi:hypothetical protein
MFVGVLSSHPHLRNKNDLQKINTIKLVIFHKPLEIYC